MKSAHKKNARKGRKRERWSSDKAEEYSLVSGPIGNRKSEKKKENVPRGTFAQTVKQAEIEKLKMYMNQ